MPKVFNGEEELAGFLREVVERVSENPEYREMFFKNGAPNRNFGIPLDLKKLGINVEGVDVVRLEFSFEDGKFVLKTAYPTKGWAVETFIPGRGGWQ